MKILSFLWSLLYMLAIIFHFPFILLENVTVKNTDLETQEKRIEELKEYYAGEDFEPVDEGSFTTFDLSLCSSIKLNEVSFIATHNSYQTTCSPAFTRFQKVLDGISFGSYNSKVSAFCSDTLTEQFNLGIRSVELDIETTVTDGEISFVCVHNPSMSTNSTCRNFPLALEEIKMWMDNNPGHMPITVIIEPKNFFLIEKNMKFFTLEYANAFDTLLRDTFGEKLITPQDMMRDYSSLKEMRENDDWMTLEQARGHIIFMMHPCNVSQSYIEQDETMKTQAMFPLVEPTEINEGYAAFAIINDPLLATQASEEVIKEKKLMVRTRSDSSFGIFEQETSTLALSSGCQIVSTDYPAKAHEVLDYTVSFENGKTVKYWGNE